MITTTIIANVMIMVIIFSCVLYLLANHHLNHGLNHDQLIKTTITTTPITNMMIMRIIFSCVLILTKF